MSQSPETVILTLGPAQKITLDLGKGSVNARKDLPGEIEPRAVGDAEIDDAVEGRELCSRFKVSDTFAPMRCERNANRMRIEPNGSQLVAELDAGAAHHLLSIDRPAMGSQTWPRQRIPLSKIHHGFAAK